MRRWLSHGAIVLVAVAVVAASAGASAMYVVLEFGPRTSPQPFSAAFANATITEVSAYNVTFPVLNASLILNSPPSLDPTGLTITITGPNATLEAWDCGQIVYVHELHESYDSNFYPHWSVTFPAAAPGSIPGAVCIWAAYMVTFTDPNGSIVGGINSNLPVASSIESGATMSMEFPGGSGFSPTGAGFTITYAEIGHPGVVTLATA